MTTPFPRPVPPPATVTVTECRLRFCRPLRPPEAALVRGYFGRAYEEEELLHHHRPDGTLRYDYPRVQFKVLDREAYLIGLAAGGDLVQRCWAETDGARLGDDDLRVLDAHLGRRPAAVGEAAGPLAYRFASPWLGLNEENYRRYQAAGDDGDRRRLLERVLVGNCLSLAKAVGHRVARHLSADGSRLRPLTTHLKGVPMLGFVGEFRVNFHIPARLGVGKSVSRGFGTVVPAAAAHAAAGDEGAGEGW